MAAIPYPTSTTVYDSLVAAKPASGKALFVIEKTFDLDAIMVANGAGTGKILTTDIVNLFTLPANLMILSAGIKSTVVQVGGTGTCTLKLRYGTTDLTAACDISAAAVAIGGATTTALPASTGAAAVLCNVVAVITGGTVTKNPTIRVTLVCVDMS